MFIDDKLEENTKTKNRERPMTMQTGRTQQRSNNLINQDSHHGLKEEKRAMTSDRNKRKPYSPVKKTKRFVKIDEMPIYVKEEN